jgi:excinuclease ABC subunit C
MADINKIVAFLKGHSAEVERYIAERMHEASERLEYEDAARWRDYLEAARAVTEKQRVELLSSGSMDIVLSVSRPIEYPSEVALPASGEGGEASGGNPDARAGVAHTVTVFFVRDGKLVGRERHMLDSGSGAAGDTEESAVAAFVSQYYANQSQPPKTILLERHIPDEQLLADALSDSAGYKVKITVPERGAKRDLVKLAQNDVGEAVRRDEKRREAETKKRERLGEQFADIFGEGFQARRVEAYDISHTGGADSVGAMVAFADGKPDKSAYRRFRIRGETRGDDYAAMQETLYRRLRRAIDRDKSFLPLPDLILIDGGKGHVAAAAQVIGAMAKSETNGADIEGIRLAGMVKDERHRTRALVVPATGDFEEYSIDEKRELLQLAAAIQEEVHRFAIEYHRKRRSKRMVGEE